MLKPIIGKRAVLGLVFMALVIFGCKLPARMTVPGTATAVGASGGARISAVQGSVFLMAPGEEIWQAAENEGTLRSVGQIFTQENSSVQLGLPGETQLRLGEHTLAAVDIQGALIPARVRVGLSGGSIMVIPGSDVLEIITQTGSVLASNAYMLARVDPESLQTVFVCFSGGCEVANPAGTLALAAGESAEMGTDSAIPPLLRPISAEDQAVWQAINPAAVSAPDATPTPGDLDFIVAAVTEAAATQAFGLTQTATALAGMPATATPPSGAAATSIPTDVPGTTVFSNVIGPTSGSISRCLNTYVTDAVDPDGVNYIKMEFSLNANFSNSTDIKLTNIGGNTYAEPVVIDTTKNGGSDTVYWRYWALDNKGNITYHPASGSFSYQDGRNCGGPVKFTNVSGPTSGAISQCANLYSVHAYDNSETLYFVKVEYASNPSFNNAKTLDLLPSGATWSGSFSIDTFAKAGTDMVYWRFWARTYQQIARYAYYPSSGSFSYSDALDCGGPTRTPSVVPTPSATASSPAATQTATVPPAASATQTATQAANSATPSPTSLPSATATSSSTAPPSATPTAAPSATPTATPSSTAPP